ncbi:TadE family type IV pilus minor pilin [Halostreptopolyspora alba]|uniref:Pilus assembly protein n=1 Tax=Halostreptopolyspora alba TaxID=2487137 RepID=A0A3N0E616_9ACTN|nr:pilus assembly protein [Nocardiopsaceae bacterium YIM 96095]
MRSRPWAERGSVTAETAVALPSLALVLGIALAAVQAAAAHLACVDAARVGARALARGDSEATVRSSVSAVAPERAETELSDEAGFARVVVRAPVALGPGIGTPFEVTGKATIPMEPEGRETRGDRHAS